ncbi:MAG: hypothetical protein P1R58_03865 [bacterium]|nr:hypothetical protein [bacterium]
MKRITQSSLWLVLLLAASFWVAAPVSAARIARTWQQITTPPEDSVDAENSRIWLPIERKNRCRVKIEIFDRQGKKVRTLYDALLGNGYFNFWWDKRDDSLIMVEPGEYTYEVEDRCAKDRTGTIVAAYREWERKCRMEILEDKYPRGVILDLLDDSATVSVRVFKFDGEQADIPFVDSLMNRGMHRLAWNPPDTVLPGRYKMKIFVGDYVETFIVRCAR